PVESGITITQAILQRRTIGGDRVDRAGIACMEGIAKTAQVIGAHPHLVGDFVRGGTSPEFDREAVDDITLCRRHLMHSSRNPYEPTMIAIMAAKSTQDRRRRERGKRNASLRLESAERDDQRFESRLIEILTGLVPTSHPP